MQARTITTLEREREKYAQESAEASGKYMQALEEVKVREMAIVDLQKKIMEAEAKLKQQQNLYEAVRSDRCAAELCSLPARVLPLVPALPVSWSWSLSFIGIPGPYRTRQGPHSSAAGPFTCPDSSPLAPLHAYAALCCAPLSLFKPLCPGPSSPWPPYRGTSTHPPPPPFSFGAGTSTRRT